MVPGYRHVALSRAVRALLFQATEGNEEQSYFCRLYIPAFDDNEMPDRKDPRTPSTHPGREPCTRHLLPPSASPSR